MATPALSHATAQHFFNIPREVPQGFTPPTFDASWDTAASISDKAWAAPKETIKTRSQCPSKEPASNKVLAIVREQLQHLVTIVDEELAHSAVPIEATLANGGLSAMNGHGHTLNGNGNGNGTHLAEYQPKNGHRSGPRMSPQPENPTKSSAMFKPMFESPVPEQALQSIDRELSEPGDLTKSPKSPTVNGMVHWDLDQQPHSPASFNPASFGRTSEERLTEMFDRTVDETKMLTAQDCYMIMRRQGYTPYYKTIKDVLRHINTIVPPQIAPKEQKDDDQISLEAFLFFMTTYDGSGVFSKYLSEGLLQLREALQLEVDRFGSIRGPASARANRRESQARHSQATIDSHHMNGMHLKSRKGKIDLALDTIPAFMILINALLIGLSSDFYAESTVWEWIELFFLLFFSCEFLFKARFQGCRKTLCGKDRWWNYFDLFCLFTASLEMSITFASRISASLDMSVNIPALMLIKILRLARLARLLRLLRFPIFRELKMMVQGVVSGMRVLAWAIVLLTFVIFLLGIMMRKLVGDQQAEFSSLEASMFTLFRCFTDGCSAYDGTPLAERLRTAYPGTAYGTIFMCMYILTILFVTIGIFNLIMAIFIDNVVTAHVQRKQQQLGENAEVTEARIETFISRRFSETGVPAGSAAEPSPVSLLEPTDRASAASDMHKEVSARDLENRVVTKVVFNAWLKDPDVLNLLEEVEVETSTKYELFDALDVDSGGELTVEELVSGLMKLRGPVSKNDIVATRLKVAYMTELVEDICRKLGIELSCDQPHENVDAMFIQEGDEDE